VPRSQSPAERDAAFAEMAHHLAERRILPADERDIGAPEFLEPDPRSEPLFTAVGISRKQRNDRGMHGQGILRGRRGLRCGEVSNEVGCNDGGLIRVRPAFWRMLCRYAHPRIELPQTFMLLFAPSL
jgi:hypothetical protein